MLLVMSSTSMQYHTFMHVQVSFSSTFRSSQLKEQASLNLTLFRKSGWLLFRICFLCNSSEYVSDPVVKTSAAPDTIPLNDCFLHHNVFTPEDLISQQCHEDHSSVINAMPAGRQGIQAALRFSLMYACRHLHHPPRKVNFVCGAITLPHTTTLST